LADDRARIEHLIARVVLRDRAAFQDLYTRTSAKLFGVALRILNNRLEAEETLQEVYIKIWTHANRYKPGLYSPMTWLITIARNAAIDRLRKRPKATDPIDDAMEVRDQRPGVEARLAAASDISQLRRCLEELPADRAEAVRGAYLEGLTYKDLAKRFDVPLNTVRSWLRRGLASLRECMSR